MFFMLLPHSGYLKLSQSFLTTVSLWFFLPKGSCLQSHLHWLGSIQFLRVSKTSYWLYHSTTPAIIKQLLSWHLFPLLYVVFCLILQGFRENLWQEKSRLVWASSQSFFHDAIQLCFFFKKKKAAVTICYYNWLSWTRRLILSLLYQKKTKEYFFFFSFPFLLPVLHYWDGASIH